MAQRTFVSGKDVFGTWVFIENMGQFNSSINSTERVKFAYESSNEHIYFTDKGLVYKLIKKFPLTHKQLEDVENGKKVKEKADEVFYVNMNWEGSNSNIEIIESQKQNYYFTSGGPELNANAYKKITYKNVYNNIDIEYTIPNDKDYGIKYNVILHPGADPSDIKIAYTGDVNKILEKNGEIIIKTPSESITEHAPESYYENDEAVFSKFKIENKIISFEFPKSYDRNKTLIVDPWVTTINLPTNNFAYDVDYDYLGNLYIYGGHLQAKVAKYSPSGNLLWVFSGSVPGIAWLADGPWANGSAGNFVVNRTSNKTYIGVGYELGGSRIIRLDPAGNYDNFVTTPDAPLSEIWEMGYYCGTGTVYGFGGGIGYNGCIVDQLTGTIQANGFGGPGPPYPSGDVVCNAIDGNGTIFVYFAPGVPSINNTILRLSPAFINYVWCVPSSYNTFLEGQNKFSYPGSGVGGNGFNCLSVNNNYLFMYDGYHLAAYDKNTGAIVGSTTVAGYSPMMQGGIAVDDCNNIYLGGNGSILCYNFNGATFNALPGILLGAASPDQYVSDIKLDRNTNKLFVCGSGFAGVYNAVASNSCGPINQLAFVSSCVGVNNNIAVATLTTNIPNPQINYVWIGIGGTVSTTYSTGVMSNSVNNLPDGTYTIQIQINAPCGPVFINTITLNSSCCQAVSITPTFIQAGCTNTINAVSLAITGPTISPTISWSPAPMSIGLNSLSATGLPVGITTISVTYGAGCPVTTATVNILPSNTIAPTNSVNPQSQVITCNSGVPVTFTGTSTNPTVNIQHDWYSPLNPLPGGVPIATSNNSISLLSGAIPPGIYTLQTTNLVNGCKSFKTVTVTSLDAWPTFGINSSTNFSVGCSPLNQTTISIINPVSTQTPPSACSYTFLAPSFTGVISPSLILGNNTSTTTQVPGTWTIIVQDNSNFCRTSISVPIIQNTIAPNVSASILTQTLSCYNPTLLATGTSSMLNTQISWMQPIAPPLVSTSTIIVGPGSGPNTSTNSLAYANYTVVATNTLNACASSSVVSISQNFKPPVSSPTISIGTPSAVFCTAGTNPVVLTTGNSTTTSNGGPLAFPVPLLWEGPSPQGTVTGASSYSCYVPGVYSLTIMDNYNGCTKTGTVNVLDRTQPPVITNPQGTATLDCGNSSAKISIILTGTNTGGLRYFFTDYPTGVAFSPTDAALFNINPDLSGTTSSNVAVSLPGNYQYMVTNTLTGCRAFGTFNVAPGDLTADFISDPVGGYAPLLVTFTNNSSSSMGSSGITSIWSFGNGTSQTTTANINAFSTYEAPGVYTVVLTALKGTCVDTAYKIIKIEIASKLEVPNIFTPNGDGSNDLFFLKTADLGEINAFIYDRWGTKVYEVLSSSGNIAWDGKNLQGKDCAAGVYFYIISAKGNDGKTYKKKGNVSLFR